MCLEDKLDLILNQQEKFNGYIELFMPDLTTEKGVIHFFEITRTTFNTYISNNTFIEGVHYIKDGKKRVFVSDKIIRLKKLGIKGKRNKNTNQDILDIANANLDMICPSRSAMRGIS